MTQDKVDMYIANNAKYFPPAKVFLLKEKLEAADDSKFNVLSGIGLKDPTMIMIVSVLVGSLGVDRFMIGDIGMGILKLLTGGVCGILAILDWFTIAGKAREKNFQEVMLVL